MALLDAGELAAAQATAAEALPETCTIKKRVRTSDGQGGHTTAKQTRAANVACRRRPLQQAEEKAMGGAAQAVSDWIFSFAAGTDIRPTDTIVMGALEYEVDDVHRTESWEITVRVEATLIGQGGPEEVA